MSGKHVFDFLNSLDRIPPDHQNFNMLLITPSGNIPLVANDVGKV